MVRPCSCNLLRGLSHQYRRVRRSLLTLCLCTAGAAFPLFLLERIFERPRTSGEATCIMGTIQDPRLIDTNVEPALMTYTPGAALTDRHCLVGLGIAKLSGSHSSTHQTSVGSPVYVPSLGVRNLVCHCMSRDDLSTVRPRLTICLLFLFFFFCFCFFNMGTMGALSSLSASTSSTTWYAIV